MDKVKFEKLLQEFDKLIDDCQECYIHSSSCFDMLTIAQVREAVAKAKQVQSNMDKVLTSEVYHIIGMGDLSAAQELQFLAKLKSYLSYRPYIKAICTYSLPTTPTIPIKTNYKCSVLKLNLNKTL